MSSTDKLLKKIVSQGSADLSDGQIERYGQRYIDYRRNYAAAGQREYEGDFPLYVLFEQTFRCNLQCPNCLQGYQSEKRKYNTGTDVMPLDLFQEVIRQCQKGQCPSVAMHNCDEPLLVKDISDRIRFASEHNIMDILMTTNGQLLTEPLARNICEAGLTHILFSIDAASSETYSKVRVNGIFEKVINAISYIREWKQNNNTTLPIIRASFVVSKNNSFEEKEFISKFRELVDYIDIQAFYSIDGLNRQFVPDHYHLVEPENFICSEPFRKVIVRANGDVVPCCSVFGYKQVVGNLYQNTIYEIFNGQLMRDLRYKLKIDNPNHVCVDCISNLYEKDFE